MSDAANLIDIKVPDIGDFDEVTVIEVLVKPGDSIKAEQSLITVPTAWACAFRRQSRFRYRVAI